MFIGHYEGRGAQNKNWVQNTLCKMTGTVSHQMSGKNVTWGKLLASRGLSPSQAKPSPPGRLGLGLEESEAKARGFQAQAGASKPSQAVTSLVLRAALGVDDPHDSDLLRGPPYTIGTTFLMRVLDPLPTRARSRKRGPGAWWLCRVGRSELRREGRLRRRYDGMKSHTKSTKCALFDAGGDLNNRRWVMRRSSAFGLVCSKIDIYSKHRRGKSGHLERAAEVALHTGEALVPRLTALYRVRPCASRVRELGNLEACWSRLKNGGGREDKVMREV
ncbi:hypothetical protein DFH08DRAFT_815822 [Mycena albidolilacea]|uniref:Uncharacterized protein n=1 Tax=Mycena albidolilacea TaxID=1033008 RepID=A0AAD6ZM10_9AGAR|nr:hypothetical protein DFH08DRAFT_815822 [Mycena albidolilacea]